jgi:thiol:disulfide interchange protein
MKRTFLFFLLFPFLISAQILTPVKWSFSQAMTSDNNYELKFTAKIDKTWHIYSQNIGDNGPVPTKFTFQTNPDAELIGKPDEPKGHEEHDPNFDMKLVWFENEVTFTQKVKITKTTKLKGNVEYMVCAMQCLPPTKEPFEFLLVGKEDVVVETQSLAIPGKTTVATTATSATTLSLALNLKNPLQFNNPMTLNTSGILDPVKWDIQGVMAPGSKGKYMITFKASIDKGFHINANKLKEKSLVPTTIVFDSLEGVKLNGELNSLSKVIEKKEAVYKEKTRYHEGESIFTQELEGELNGFIKGHIEYQTCDDSKCLPPQKVPFELMIKDGQITNFESIKTAVGIDVRMPDSKFQYKLPGIDLVNPINDCVVKADDVKGKGLWTIFILGFIGGLLALITPCVFPMIPLTVSFFTKSAEGKKGMFSAMMYGFFIFMVYVLLSLPFHLLSSIDENIFNTISTNAWLNVAFFVVFVVFAISFFGYFEITLPSALANRADSASNLGGMIGIFFMSLTLAVVSFSCTGPILGTLLAGSLTSDGGAWQLTAGMAGFGLALALPFSLFAAFPAWLNKLPKSGSWLSKVKVVLGFIELALAIKFLSNADLVEHWGILKYEIFLGSWIIIALLLLIYLLGKIKFPHDSPFQKWTGARSVMAAFALVCVVYFSFGFRYDKATHTYDSLSLLSGLPPPPGYSIVYPNSCPQNLNCFHSYEEGLAYAKQTGKPIMLDFTGWACVNCRKMEENVWNQPEVFKLINEKYVLISLYVDDREKLPLDQQHDYVTAQGKLKHIETVGDKWATFQTETFVNNSQPWYPLISNDGKLLVKPVGNTPDPAKFAAYLTCGLEAANKK